MNTFAQRRSKHDAFELEVLERLSEHGYEAFRFGQALLPERAREILRDHTTAMRWLPDLLICGNHRIVLADAKTSPSDTPNYSIETSALTAHSAFATWLGTLHFYVFPDFTIASPDDVFSFGQEWTGDRHGLRGSGTPFWLLPKRLTRAFETAFPPL